VLGNRVIYGFLFAVPNLLFFLRFTAFNDVFEYENFFIGMMIWITYAVVGKLDAKIQPVEAVSWSWVKVKRQLPKILFFGLVGGLIAGGIIDFTLFFFHALPGGLAPFFLPILVLALGIGLSLALMLGVSHEVLDTHNRTRPNQGIRNSLRNGIVLGLVYGLVVGLLSGIILSLVRVVAFTHIPGSSAFVVLSHYVAPPRDQSRSTSGDISPNHLSYSGVQEDEA